MPTLPTLTVTQAQADRMLDAYGSVDNYKRWLADQIIAFVNQKEQVRKHSVFVAQAQAEAENVRNELLPAELQE